MVRPESVRSVIALSCKEGLKTHQMDITTAFLNGDLEEMIYIYESARRIYYKRSKASVLLVKKKSVWSQAFSQVLESGTRHTAEINGI